MASDLRYGRHKMLCLLRVKIMPGAVDCQGFACFFSSTLDFISERFMVIKSLIRVRGYRNTVWKDTPTTKQTMAMVVILLFALPTVKHTL